MILELEETKSTNSYAKMHINTLNDGDVVHAYAQTNGRGRLNRSWVDLGPGNLFFSIVLKPSKKLSPIYSNITQYAAIILCKILETYNINPKIKWPNDIMIDGERKISGILSETVLQSGNLEGIVLGIGINLKADKKNVDDIPNKKATALNLETGKEIDMKDFLNNFLDLFFKNYTDFLEKGFEYIKDEYIKRNCFLNRDIKIQILNEIKEGFAKDLNNNGELVLITNDNKELVLNIGDIL